jgi:RNA polymerase sigma-70 factor (ECF subfamily)
MQLRSPTIHTAAIDERVTAARDEEAEKAGHEEREESLHALEEALEQLGEQQRVCIRLFYLNKKSYREVAVATGYALNEVKSHIQNGKRNLRAIIERKKGNEQ